MRVCVWYFVMGGRWFEHQVEVCVCSGIRVLLGRWTCGVHFERYVFVSFSKSLPYRCFGVCVHVCVYMRVSEALYIPVCLSTSVCACMYASV